MAGFQGWLTTAAGPVPLISTSLTFRDRLGGCKARWGIGRMTYLVPPGLYAIGAPTEDAPVVVTANYKMSYDLVRRSLAGRNVWLLVLETYGINVWCAAGKGTFGTGELVRRIAATRLGSVVRHRRLLLPILGAPGVAAHEVARRSGFSVRYATIRAEDLPAYLDNGMVATPIMRQVTFSLYERLVLIPVELVLALRSLLVIAGIAGLLAFLAGDLHAASAAFWGYAGAAVAGIAVGPLLLPWLPGRSFAVKGGVVGLCWSLLFTGLAGRGWNGTVVLAVMLALTAVSSFYTLNFTGCTPFTSRSGVKKEMRIALPAMGGALAAAILLLLGQLVWNGALR